MRSAEFLIAVSTTLESKDDAFNLSKDLILKLCNNFVVFDDQLDMFRFAHLSVREFLEKRPEYESTSIHAFAGEVCLWHLIHLSPNPTARNFLFEQYMATRTTSPVSGNLIEYGNLYWATHCQLAAEQRASGSLRSIFRFYVSGKGGHVCPIALWKASLPIFSMSSYSDFLLAMRLHDAELDSESVEDFIWFVACIFNFFEILSDSKELENFNVGLKNRHGQTMIDVASDNRNYESFRVLLNASTIKTRIVRKMVEVVARNSETGSEIMIVLLDEVSDRITITERIVKAAAGNGICGKRLMALLLDRRGGEVKITEKVIT